MSLTQGKYFSTSVLSGHNSVCDHDITNKTKCSPLCVDYKAL